MAALMFDPYGTEQSACRALSRFADAVFSTPTGLIWAEADGAKVLRRPAYAAEGFGITLIAISHGAEPAAMATSTPTQWLPRNGFLRGMMVAAQAMSQQEQDYQQALAQGMAVTVGEVRDFLNAHQTLADGIATGLDVLGLIAGTAAVFAMAPVVLGAATLGGVVGVTAAFTATVGSVGLLTCDAKMFTFDLEGDQAARSAFEKTAYYRWVEAVGPLLLLPDLLVNFPRAVVGVAKAARELQSAPREIGELTEKALAGREALGLVDKPAVLAAHPQIAADVQRLKLATDKLSHEIAKAEKKLETAKDELRAAHLRDMPAAAGTVFGTTIYTINPPELTKAAASRLGSLLQPSPKAPQIGLPSATDFLRSTPNAAASDAPASVNSDSSVWSLWRRKQWARARVPAGRKSNLG